jgi:acyl-coenzyme A synthetase/AMP-(fatty) acid ligase
MTNSPRTANLGKYTHDVKTFIEFRKTEVEQSITDRFEEQVRRYDVGYRLPDGCLVNMGRKDFQTKIRGHRVELSAVEMALLGIEVIKQAAVVSIGDTGDDKRHSLVLYTAYFPRCAPNSGLMELGMMQPIGD